MSPDCFVTYVPDRSRASRCTEQKKPRGGNCERENGAPPKMLRGWLYLCRLRVFDLRRPSWGRRWWAARRL